MRPTAVYRLYASDGVLLYVGVTYDFDKRFKEHAKKRWWPDVAHKDVIWFMDRSDALYEEARAIAEEAPVYNERPGIGPIGAKVIRRDPWSYPWGCPPPMGVLLVDKWRVAEAFKETSRGHAHIEVSVEGEPVGIGVSLRWYLAACEKLGEPADLGRLRTVDLDAYV